MKFASIAQIAAIALAAVLSACSSDRLYQTAPSDKGVAAYRAKNFDQAWALLSPLAEEGHFRAQRYVAFMLLEGNAPIDCGALCVEKAVGLLLDSARRGDNNAVVVLEAMIANDASYAPENSDMLAMETARAERGDPVMAWRLAQRYSTGEGVRSSVADTVKWLKVAAHKNSRLYPKAPDAAFQLCEIYAGGDLVDVNFAEARQWCKRAAKNGHSGAAIVLANLKDE